MERESIDFDVVVVGGGPAGLACAIGLMGLARENGVDLEVCLIEKGAEIGAHALSGAVMNPAALKELLPDYLDAGCPVEADVRGDELYYLTERNATLMPIVPKWLHNNGFHIISLSRFTKWLGEIAENMGVNIFPGFAGTEVLFGGDGKTVTGVRTGDKGLDRDGGEKGSFEPGIDLKAKVTVFAEGARGSLTQSVADKLNLFADKAPQIFETGVKETIELSGENYFATSRGNVVHTLGHPLGFNIPGGGFIYEMKENRIALGCIVGLSYEDPGLDIYDIFMRFKRHPLVSDIIKGGKVIAQGARTVCNGGWHTLCKPASAGALFTGGAAGMQNPAALKGIHLSMKSGMLAAEAIMEALNRNDFSEETLLAGYNDLFEKSWARGEMYKSRNFAQAVAKKGFSKIFHLGVQYTCNGWDMLDPMSAPEDFETLKPLKGDPDATPAEKISYDGELHVDKLTGVYLSKTAHREDQPCHLIVRDKDLCTTQCREKYGSPCVRFCPGGVYEMTVDEKSKERKLMINFSNCLHCKTCEIKDPYRNITWTCPEGGDGPGYSNL